MESRPPTPCSICGRWSSPAGAGVCGVCRAARAIASIPFDSRVSVEGYHYILSILDRTVGEIYGWIATQPSLPPILLPPGVAPTPVGVSPDNSGASPAEAGVAPSLPKSAQAAGSGNPAPVLAGARPKTTTGKSRSQERKERKEESRKSQSAAKGETGLVKVEVTDQEQARQEQASEEKRKTTAEEGDTRPPLPRRRAVTQRPASEEPLGSDARSRPQKKKKNKGQKHKARGEARKQERLARKKEKAALPTEDSEDSWSF